MIIISAMSQNRVIGNLAGDGMPWSLPEEYQQFLTYIKGQAVIMGRKTYEIFQGDITASQVFVVSRSLHELATATVCASLAEALEKANATGREVYVSGGGTIYEQALPYAEKMYLSTIEGEYEGNTFFPEFDVRDWDVTTREQRTGYEFLIYQRKSE